MNSRKVYRCRKTSWVPVRGMLTFLVGMILLAGLAGPASCRGGDAGEGEPQHLDTVTLRVAGHSVTAEVAADPGERAKGLMYRKSLPEDRGMLFVFEEERRPGFYMKNTTIPLSIAYIAKDGTIRGIHRMNPLSEATVKSRRAVLYALEMNQGWFDERDIRPGDRVEIPPEVAP